MDFIAGLPPSHGCLVIMVIVGCLLKFAHFIPLPSDFSAKLVMNLFIQHIVKIHGIQHSIVLDRNKLFTSKFWQHLFQKQGTTLVMSFFYHPQMDD